MREVRAYARENKAALDAEWDALEEPPRTFAQHAAYARKAKAEAEALWGPEYKRTLCIEQAVENERN